MSSTEAQKAQELAGINRTGVVTAPLLSREMVEGAASAPPSSEGGPQQLMLRRAQYISEGFTVGSLPPPPVSLEGVLEGAARLVGTTTGASLLADKLSERLGFERTGTRLYDALINKCEALGESTPGPTLAELREIRDEELRHFHLLHAAITSLGGDPTVMSPCADTGMVASLGLLQVLTDPRTTLPQCLQAILTAELTDNDGWAMLIDLADGLGHDEFVGRFRQALANEEKHLASVRGWLTAMLREQAKA
ncbi:MAG TPA: ferritin-like domain-containing protein [Pyrinomonadaceae bacterium]|jgi:bacterioferritin (cytochrome b1)|nr:ferritin-like domain-containing protein [Pyrinomonadaceae bacterium]